MIELEPTTFKIPVTDDWKVCENREWKEAPSGDVWVHTESGEQLFTFDSAIRHAKQLGKRLPTNEELEELNPKNLAGFLAGHRSSNGTLYGQGARAYIWSSSESSSDAWFWNLLHGYSTIARNAFTRDFGFSVRYVKEQEQKEDYKCMSSLLCPHCNEQIIISVK